MNSARRRVHRTPKAGDICVFYFGQTSVLQGEPRNFLSRAGGFILASGDCFQCLFICRGFSFLGLFPDLDIQLFVQDLTELRRRRNIQIGLFRELPDCPLVLFHFCNYFGRNRIKASSVKRNPNELHSSQDSHERKLDILRDGRQVFVPKALGHVGRQIGVCKRCQHGFDFVRRSSEVKRDSQRKSQMPFGDGIHIRSFRVTQKLMRDVDIEAVTDKLDIISIPEVLTKVLQIPAALFDLGVLQNVLQDVARIRVIQRQHSY
mmetsp:Transcript_2002/g.5383  ORF Transcript_2002/g.5383 Transcript_2002/m.5383 type:complete len:262 (+) Transcript_2002:1448-2233(+)